MDTKVIITSVVYLTHVLTTTECSSAEGRKLKVLSVSAWSSSIRGFLRKRIGNYDRFRSKKAEST